MQRNLICHDPGRNSHKFWRINVVGNEHRLEWGRVGTTGQSKTKVFGSASEATNAAWTIINEKLAKGYVDVSGVPQSNTPAPTPTAPAPSTMPSTLRPMLAEEIDAGRDLARYAQDARYVFEAKLDGQRVMLQVESGSVAAIGRNGQASQHAPRFRDRRHAPDLARLAKMGEVVLDGELVGDKFWIFDMPTLEWRGGIEMVFDANEPWHVRRRALGLLFRAWNPDSDLFGLLPYAEGTDDKVALAEDLMKRNCEGVIVKNADAPYRWGRRCSDVLKAKYWKTADVIVTAVSTGGKSNAELAAYKDGALVSVGRCSTNGKGAVAAGMVVEVKYLYLGPGDRLVQPDLLRIRTDKSGPECTFDQLVKTSKEVLA